VLNIKHGTYSPTTLRRHTGTWVAATLWVHRRQSTLYSSCRTSGVERECVSRICRGSHHGPSYSDQTYPNMLAMSLSVAVVIMDPNMPLLPIRHVIRHHLRTSRPCAHRSHLPPSGYDPLPSGFVLPMRMVDKSYVRSGAEGFPLEVGGSQLGPDHVDCHDDGGHAHQANDHRHPARALLALFGEVAIRQQDH